MKPIFLELSHEDLLVRCLHRKTQNQNESLNGMIWSRIPKDTFVKLGQFEMGVYDAVAHFNQGNAATLQIYENMNVVPGYYTTIGCSKANISRLKNAFRQSVQARKAKGDKKKEQEGKLYGPGDF